LIRLAVRCRRADAELALPDLLELSPGGVEEVPAPGDDSELVEYAIYGAPGELPDVGALQAAIGGALVEVRSERVPDDWRERWKRFYHPLLIAGRLYVRPPWERSAERGGVAEVVIDPGQAFGTGTHPTTSMCLELLVDAAGGRHRLLERLRLRRRRSACDLGCGSGVLAIAAAKLGLRPVVGVDLEQSALAAGDRNARRNYVDIEFRRLDLRREKAPVADVVTANLTAELLGCVADRWAEGGARPRTLIASGFLTGEADQVLERLTKAGLREERRLADRGWSAAVLSGQSAQAR
jgi:ribosomal protein L11 methyltransferase